MAIEGSPGARAQIALATLTATDRHAGDAERLLWSGLLRARDETDPEAIAFALERLAATADDPARAARLLGAAESVREEAKVRRDRFEADDTSLIEAAVRSTLGSSTFERLSAAGARRPSSRRLRPPVRRRERLTPHLSVDARSRLPGTQWTSPAPRTGAVAPRWQPTPVAWQAGGSAAAHDQRA
jgi:hypothetical protein